MNSTNTAGPGCAADSPISTAQEKTGKVKTDLELASAELQLSSTALDRHLPADTKKGDVARALEQNAAVEIKVQEAAGELAEVTELLQEEVAQRHQLERKLARADGAGSRK